MWQGGHGLGGLLSLQFNSLPPGAEKTAISNLQEGLVIVDVSFKLQMGAAKN